MGRIVGGGRGSIYAFKIMKELISVNITKLTFLNINILKMNVSAYISIHSIHVTGMSPSSLMVLNIRRDDNEAVFIPSTTFPGVSARIFISNSYFTNVGTFYFRLSGNEFNSFLTITDSVFTNFTLARPMDIYSFITGIFVEGGNGSLNIYNCSLNHNNRANVLLFISKTDTINISSSRFLTLMEYGVVAWICGYILLE